MTRLCDLPGVRGGDTGFPVQLALDEETGRLVIRAINEGGFACVDIDLCDLAHWFGVDAERFVASLAIGAHPE